MNLTTLSLGETQVLGTLSALRRMSGMGTLNLTKTNISGYIHELHMMKGLERLLLSKTWILGTLGSLSSIDLPALRTIDLSSTLISGWFLQKGGRRYMNLREANLAATCLL